MYDFRRKTLLFGFGIETRYPRFGIPPLKAQNDYIFFVLPDYAYAIGWVSFTLLAVQANNLNSTLPTQTHQLHHLASRTAFSNTVTSYRKTAILLKLSNVTLPLQSSSLQSKYVDKPTQWPGQPGPTTFDLRAILQKRGYFRITSVAEQSHCLLHVKELKVTKTELKRQIGD